MRTQLVEAEVHSRTSHERLTVLEPQLALLTQQLAASTHARTGAEEDAELAREGSGKMLKQVRIQFSTGRCKQRTKLTFKNKDSVMLVRSVV